MTLVIGATSHWYSLLVSDRLVTLQNRAGRYVGDHDVVANKSLIFLTTDGLVLLGYTGAAYLEGIPTDQWIAQVLWGDAILPIRP